MARFASFKRFLFDNSWTIVHPYLMKLLTFPNSESWIAGLIEEWQRAGSSAIDQRGEFFVALSGGSTPAAFYKALAASSWGWSATRLFLGDERDVPLDHKDSNYRMVHESFYPHQVKIERWKTELEDPVATAEDYARRLKNIVCQPVRFDLILLGIGNDGHTASLFPGTTGLEEKHRLTTSVWVPQVEQHRLTFTYPLIKQSRAVWFLANGPSKSPWIQKMVEGTDRSFPASRIECDAEEPKIFFTA